MSLRMINVIALVVILALQSACNSSTNDTVDDTYEVPVPPVAARSNAGRAQLKKETVPQPEVSTEDLEREARRIEEERLRNAIVQNLEDFDRRLDGLFRMENDLKYSQEAMRDIKVKYAVVSTAKESYKAFYREMELFGAEYGEMFSSQQKSTFQGLLDRCENYFEMAKQETYILGTGL